MKRSMIVLLTVCLLMSGCALQRGTSVAYGPAPENCLTIYSPLEERIWSPFVREFQERSGIWVQVEQGSASELLEAFQKEPEKCDLLFGFDMEALSECETMLTEIPAPEEENGTSGASGLRSVCVFRELPVIVCNPRLLQKNLPTGLLDLSDERWQGSFSMEDPAESAFGKAVLTVLTQLDSHRTAKEMLRQFRDNVASFEDHPGKVLRNVNDGTYLLGVVPESGALEAISRGTGLSIVYPEEGSFLFPVGAAISQDAVHPEHAGAFLEFLLEEDTQRHAWEFLHLRPALDQGEFLPDNACMQEEPGNASQRRLMELWKQIREERP